MNQAVGGGYKQPPLNLQLQHVIAAPIHMEDGGATQDGPGKSCNEGGLMAHRRQPGLLTATYPPRSRGNCDCTRLPHQGPRRGRRRPEYIFVSRPLPLGRVGGGAPHSGVVRNLGRRHLNFLRGHESADGNAKGRPYRRLERGSVPTQGLGHLLHSFPGRLWVPPRHVKDVTPPVGYIRDKPEAEVVSPPETHLPCRPPSPDIAGVQQELTTGVGEATQGAVAKL